MHTHTCMRAHSVRDGDRVFRVIRASKMVVKKDLQLIVCSCVFEPRGLSR